MTNQAHPVPLFPEEDWKRKMLPVFKQLTRYFPRAFREMTKVSVVNNIRFNPTSQANDINWARGKSIHQMDSALKHMMEHADGKVFDTVDPVTAKTTGIDRIYILAQAMWRIGAELELLIEKTEGDELAEQVKQELYGETVNAAIDRVTGTFDAVVDPVREVNEFYDKTTKVPHDFFKKLG